MTTPKLDAKITKWRNRPLQHVTKEELAELVADLREETVVYEAVRRKVQSEAAIKRILFGKKRA